MPTKSRKVDAMDNGQGKFRQTDEFVAGLTAAFLNTTFLFPVNKLIFRQMAGGYRALFAADQMKEEGFRYLYRGILPPLIQKMVSVSIMFGSFGHYKKWADNKFTTSHPVMNLALASCLTGATEAILTPLERVQMLLQDRKFHREYRNTFDALIKLHTFGFKEYYRGLTCVLFRNGPSNILFFGLRDEIKLLLQNFAQPEQLQTTTIINKNFASHNSGIKRNETLYTDKSSNNDNSFLTPEQKHYLISSPPPITASKFLIPDRDSILYDFLSGAILGMFISTLFYPLSVVRTRMQTRTPGTEFLSIVKAFRAVYRERDRKFSRFFHGCSINVFRQFLSWGIINCSYETVLRFLHKF